MDRIRSRKDLEMARQEALDRQADDVKDCRFQIRISLGSCSIGAGACETQDAINQFIRDNQIHGIRTKNIGCIGLCALEPVIQVIDSDNQMVTYGKVTPAVLQRIFKEHIEKHIILQEYVVDNI